VAAAAYGPAFRAGFVFDDHVLVEHGDLVHGPLWRIWFSAGASDYWPLTWTGLWIEARLWGEQAWAYHATNIALHALVAVLLWRVLEALRLPGAWWAALLFAVHPVTVESVAWISEQKNTLSAALCLASVLAWLRYDEKGRRIDVIASWALFLLALLAKASVVMLPFVLLGIVLHRRGRVSRADVKILAPFFALALVLGSVTLWFQWTHAMQEQIAAWRGPGERLGGTGWALASYLQKAFAPIGLGFVYGDWPVSPGSAWFYAPALLVVALSGLLWRYRRHPAGRATAAALGYHALMVLPVLGLVEIAYFHVGPVSNHLQYLALIGPVALMAAGLARLARWSRPLAVTVTTATVLLLAASTFRRAGAFEDDLSLWQAAARDAPASLYATWMYADELGAAGRKAEALAALERFANGSDDEAARHRARGLWLFHSGRYPEALDETLAADRLRANPELQVEMGQLLTRAGRTAEAIQVLDPLVERAPRYADARYWLGAALARAGRLAEAAAVLREGRRLTPGDRRMAEALAVVLERLGDRGERVP
jgi:Flp pilus assembly protein TadD